MGRKQLSRTDLEFIGIVLIAAVFLLKAKLNLNWKMTLIAAAGIAIAAIIIYAVIKFAVRRAKMSRYRRSTLAQIDAMSGEDFERYLQAVFYGAGYHAHLTPQSNDFGADLIFTSDKTRTVVQAKRYKNPVGIEAVQQVIGALYYYNADIAFVITNSYFTPSARKLAAAANVILWDRNDLLMMTNDNITENLRTEIEQYKGRKKR